MKKSIGEAVKDFDQLQKGEALVGFVGGIWVGKKKAQHRKRRRLQQIEIVNEGGDHRLRGRNSKGTKKFDDLGNPRNQKRNSPKGRGDHIRHESLSACRAEKIRTNVEGVKGADALGTRLLPRGCASWSRKEE